MNWNTLFQKKGRTRFVRVKRIYRSFHLDLRAKIISVVGTNGKGSVANYLNQGLLSNQKKVGLFTSPHLLVPNERIKINNKNITDQEVEKILEKIPNNLHFFATIFLVAMIWFAQNNVDFIILEAGIGGKKDVTNVLKVDFGVVTSIGLDHTDLLGKTQLEIAQEKAGIINQSIKFFIPLSLEKSLQNIFLQKVLRTKSTNFSFINNVSDSYKMRNKKLVQIILQKAFNIKYPLVNFEDPPCRTKIYTHQGVNIILDVAHNFDGIQASLNYLINKKITFKQVIICLRKNKKKNKILKLFSKYKIFIHQLNDSYWHASDFDSKRVEEAHNLKDLINNPKKSTLFIGSFYFIGKILCEKK